MDWEESIQESEPGLLTNPRRDQTSRERISAPHWTHRGRTAGRGSGRDGEGEGAASPVVMRSAATRRELVIVVVPVPAGLDWMANGSARPLCLAGMGTRTSTFVSFLLFSFHFQNEEEKCISV